jgi:prevent-host-death family protein
MKTATIRDLRNHFPRVATWIEQGEPVQITRAGKPFARLVPLAPAKPRRLKMPDVMDRLRRTWGERRFSAGEVEAMRAEELAREDG